jgi:formiminotetrahydrofolate cyclodeaminase
MNEFETPGRTLDGYIELVAQPAPAPGAGSVAGIVGALGCALGEMVCGITLGNPNASPVERLRPAFELLTTNRNELVRLAGQDEEAYGRYREARAMPKSGDAERRARTTAMATTLEWAAEVPLRIAETSASSLEELVVVADLGSRYALADVSTAVYSLEASARGAIENVWVNLRIMKDRETRELLRARADDALLRCSLAVHSATDVISRRSRNGDESSTPKSMAE